MAIKTIKKSGNYNYKLDKKMKDDVYVFSNNSAANGTRLNFSFKGISESNIARNGSDLILSVAFGTDISNYKVNLITIKDYYLYVSPMNNNLVTINGESIYEEAISSHIDRFFDYPTVYTYGSSISGYGSKNSTYYVLADGDDNSITEFGGDDVYKISSVTSIHDVSGNDVYNNEFDDVDESKEASVMDFKGNDLYKISRNSAFSSQDFAGNDKYDFTEATVGVSDAKGNDIYTGLQLKGNIQDWDGNDKYDVTTANSLVVVDNKGTDEYNIMNAYTLSITDGQAGSKKGGNDKYNISFYSSNVQLNDYFGNEKYNLSNISGLSIIDEKGNDVYDLKRVNPIDSSTQSTIYDKAGNDNYIVENSNLLLMQDFNGKDKYNLSYSNGIVINDLGKGKDIYKIADCNGININESDERYSQNDIYIIDRVSNLNTFDYIGNEKYVLNKVSGGNMSDISGNDTYNLNRVDSFTLFDRIGKNKFTVQNSSSLNLNTFGNINSYNISDSQGISIGNHPYPNVKGKNTYNVNNTIHLTINNTNTKSNDVYNLNGIDNSDIYTSVAQIFDQGGNDKFNVKNSKSVCIQTVESGTKTFNISNSDHIQIRAHKNGKKKDTYNISNVNSFYSFTTGKVDDVYNLNNVDNGEDTSTYYLEDLYGNDKYDIKKSENIYVYNQFGKDIYNITNSENINISDGDYNTADYDSDEFNADNLTDTYIVKNSVNAFVSDYSKTSNDIYKFTNVSNDSWDLAEAIWDLGGNDNYTVNKSSNIMIWDRGEGNDKYTFDTLKSKLYIQDDGGNKDSLKLANVKSNNLIYMTDFKKKTNESYAGDVNSGNLIIFDLNQKDGGMVIKDYFELDGDRIDTTSTGDGYIEKIYAGKKEVSSKIQNYLDSVDYNSIASNIANWLSNNSSAGCVSDLFEQGYENDLNNFVSYIKDTHNY